MGPRFLSPRSTDHPIRSPFFISLSDTKVERSPVEKTINRLMCMEKNKHLVLPAPHFFRFSITSNHRPPIWCIYFLITICILLHFNLNKLRAEA